MMKRRSDDGSDDACLPPKRLAIGSSSIPSGSGRSQASSLKIYRAEPVWAAQSSGPLTQDGTFQVWLAVAAQVQDALAALPGWMQIAQGAQLNQPEQLSSLSSASTPLPAQQQSAGTLDCGSWPTQASATQLGSQNLLVAATTAHQRGGSSSPAVPVAAAAAVATPALAPSAADLPAQPAPAVATAASAPNSSASESETAAAACGWFSKCRGCCQLTAGEVELQGHVVPLCRGCSSSMHRRPPVEREHAVQRIMRAHAALCQREAATVLAGCSSS